MKKLLLAFLFLTGLASAQIFSTAASSIRHGAMLPATCNDSQVFFVNGVGAYQCISGVWEAIPTSVSGTGTVTNVQLAGTVNKVTVSGTCNITVTGTCTITIPDGVVLVGPALGTPASGNLANATGLPISTGVSGLGTGVATFLTTPSGANLASALTTALPISKGGSGATSQQAAFDALAPTATRAGDVTYWNGTHYVNLAGNNAGTKVLQEDASGVPTWASPGTGSVTSVATSAPLGGGTITTSGTLTCATCVTSAAALTSTAIVTGGGSQAAQTPSTTATLDSSGNFSTPGAFSTGVGGSAAGFWQCTEGTAHTADANSTGFQCPTSVTSAFMFTLPGAPAAGIGRYTNAAPSVMSVAELSGDASTSGSNVVTVAKVNGIAYSATAAAHSVEVITTANTTATAKTLPDCTDTNGNHLNFTQSSDSFSCGTSSGSGGGGAGFSGTATLGTSAISSGACATVVTVLKTGMTTTNALNWTFNADPTGVTGYAPSTNGMLTIIAYPTADNANFKVCNNTASSITPGAITLNFSAAQGAIATGTSALGTGAISSGACATVVTTSATGTATTSTIAASFNGDPTAVTGYTPTTGGMLTIIGYPTANNVNWKVCNNTTGSITPGAITLNWRVF